MGKYRRTLGRAHAVVAGAIALLLAAGGGALLASETGPAVRATEPSDGTATSDSLPVIAVEFDEPVRKSDLADEAVFVTITASDASDQPTGVRAEISEDVVTLFYTGTLPDGRLADGAYVVRVPAGYVESVPVDPAAPPVPGGEATWRFTVDTQAPMVELDDVSPPSGGLLRVSGRADSDARLTVTVDDEDLATGAVSQGQTQGGPFEFLFDVSRMTPGELTIDAAVVDAAGNAGSAQDTTTMDGQGPTPADGDPYAPADGAEIGNATPEVSLRFDETVFLQTDQSAPRPELRRDGDPEPMTTAAVVEGESANKLRITYGGTLEDGSYTVSVPDGALTDVDGNANVAAQWSFSVSAGNVTIDATMDDLVNAEEAEAFTVAGTAPASTSIDVVVTAAAGGSREVTGVAVTDGRYSATLNLTGTPLFADGPMDVTVTATAGETPVGAATAPSHLDTIAPRVPTVNVSPNPYLGATDLTVSGETEPKAAVAITVSDTGTGSAAREEIVARELPDADHGAGSYEAAFTTTELDGLSDGPLDVRVQAWDEAGNHAEGTASVAKDVNAPAVTVAGDAGDSQVVFTFDRALDPATVDDDSAGGWDDFTASSARVIDALLLADDQRSITLHFDGPLASDDAITLHAGAVRTSDSNANREHVHGIAPEPPVVEDATDPVHQSNEDAFEVSGRAEAGATAEVTVSDGVDAVVGMTTVAADGTFAVTGMDVGELADGPLAVTATARKAYTSAASAALQVTKGTALAAPENLAHDPAINAANAGAFTVTGSAPVGSTVTVQMVRDASNKVSGSAVASDTGAFSVTLDIRALADGAVTLRVQAERDGNTSAVVTETLTKDTQSVVAITAPASGEVIGAADASAVDIAGTSDADAAISVTIDDEVVPTAPVELSTAAVGSNWSLPDVDLSVLEDGVVTITAVATDTYGNTSAIVTRTVILKTAASVVLADEVPSHINLANEQAVTINGIAEPGGTVAVTLKGTDPDAGDASPDSDGTLSQDVTAGTDGAFTATFDTRHRGLEPGDLPGLAHEGIGDGPVTVTAETRDAGGNSASDTRVIHKDTVEPAVPTLDPVSPANAANAAAFTVTGAVSDTGSEGGATAIDVTFVSQGGDEEHGETLRALVADGTWTATLDVSALADDPEAQIQATAVDAAGNRSGDATATTFKDTVVPEPPTVVLTPDPINIDTAEEVEVRGDAESDATVHLVLSDDTGFALDPFTAASGGSYTFAGLDVSALDDGEIRASVTVSDAAGNVSTPGTATAMKRTVLPSAPLIGSVTDPINADNDDAVRVEGTAPAGTTVILTVGTLTPKPTITADADGQFAFPAVDVSSLGEGTLSFTAVSRDAAGNTSAPSGAVTALYDKTAPAAPPAPVFGDAGANSVNETALPVVVTAEAGTTIVVTVSDGTDEASAAAAATGGADSIPVDVSALADGQLSATATATDASGNASLSSGAASIVKDTALPSFTTVGASGAEAVTFTSDRALDASSIDTRATGGFDDFAITGTKTILGVTFDATGQRAIRVRLSGPLVGGETVTLLDNAVLTVSGNPNDEHVHTAAPVEVVIDSVPEHATGANQDAVPVTGHTQPGAVVTLTGGDGDGSTAPVNATAASDGSWAADLDVSSLADGAVTVTAVAQYATFTSAPATAALLKDTTASVAIDQLPAWVGAADQAAMPVGGSADPGATVDIAVMDTTGGAAEKASPSPSGQAVADEEGRWSATLDVSGLVDGQLKVFATAVDAVGNTGTDQDQETSRKDTAAPAAPAVEPPSPVREGDTTLTVNGRAEAGSVAQVVVDDTVAASPSATAEAPVSAAGTFTVVVDVTALADGVLEISSTVRDPARNPSAAGGLSRTLKDIVAPAPKDGSVTPADGALIADANPDAVQVVVRDNQRLIVQPTLALASLRPAGADRQPVLTQVLFTPDSSEAASGTVRFVYHESFDDGVYTAVIPEGAFADAVGNRSAPIAWTFAVDTTAPPLELDELGAVTSGNASAYTVSGATDAGADLSVLIEDETGGTVELDAVPEADGGFAVTGDLSGLADGALSVAVRATDAAGNQGDATADALKDTLGPDAPGITTVSDPVDAATEGVLSLDGDTEPDATIQIVVSDDAESTDDVHDFATADAEGAYSAAVALQSLQDGALTVTVTATDVQGNPGEPAAVTVTKALILPDVPENITATGGVKTASVGWQPPADNGAVLVSYIVRAAGSSTSMTVPADASSATISDLPAGTYRFTVTAVSTAGEGAPSAESSPVSVSSGTAGGGGGGGGGTSPTPTPSPTPSPTAASPSPTSTPTPAPSTSPAPGPLPGNEAGTARVSGGSRTGTAVTLSTQAFPDGAREVFVATAAAFADALAAGPAAAHQGGPVLLVDRDTLPDTTRAEIERLGARRIVVLGGSEAVSTEVEAQLAALGAEVDRLSGGDRYSTAATVSRSTFPERVGVAYIATGEGFADALSGGVAAARNDGPVLLVSHSDVPQATQEELQRLSPRRIVVLGGHAAVPADVAARLDQYTDGEVERVSGSDRYATAAAISARVFPDPVDTVYVATGENFPDALAAVPAAAKERAPLLLVRRDDVPEVIAAELTRLRPRRIVLLGGDAAVSDRTETSLRRYVVD